MAASGLSLVGNHLISQIKFKGLTTLNTQLPERIFMNEVQKEQWIQEFTGNIGLQELAQLKIPLDLKLDGIVDICTSRRVDICRTTWLIKVVARHEMAQARPTTLSTQQHAKQSFDFTKVFRSSILRQLEDISKIQNVVDGKKLMQSKLGKWRYTLALSVMLYRDGLLLNSEFLNDVLMIFAKCSIRQVQIQF